MNIQDIINEGRPVEPDCFESDKEETWYKIGVHDCFDYLEQNRIKACDNLSDEEFERESEFVVPFMKEHHRTPTFSEAIEATRKQMIDKACKYLSDHIDKDLTIYHNETWLRLEEFINRLRKSMEE